MTREEFIKTLKIIADMGDRQIEALANVLIDYFGQNEGQIGFGVDKKDKKEDRE